MGINKISATIIENIQIDLPYKRILNRLGYRKNTDIKKNQKDSINKIISLSGSYCNLKGLYQKFKIIKKNNNTVELENNIKFVSEKLINFLKDSSGVFIIAVTSGSKIVEYRDELINNDLVSSVIADAVGSELVESMAEWLHEFLLNAIVKDGLNVTKNRFSPGYGDFELKNQRIIFDLLELDRIGIKLLDNYILIPEKSITAIIGIR